MTITQETEKTINKVVQEFSNKEVTTVELQKILKMNRNEFASFMISLTYRSLVYEYRKGKYIYIGFLKE